VDLFFYYFPDFDFGSEEFLEPLADLVELFELFCSL